MSRDDPNGWLDQAACKGSTTLFFPARPTNRAWERAQAICEECPVLAACRAYITAAEAGLGLSSRHGMAAAMTPEERFTADRTVGRRPRGAPKHGTRNAYLAHYRRNEKPCAACVAGRAQERKEQRS